LSDSYIASDLAWFLPTCVLYKFTYLFNIWCNWWC